MVTARSRQLSFVVLLLGREVGDNVAVTAMSFRTKMWVGFGASLSCTIITLLWVGISFSTSATEPKWPGQDIAAYGTLNSILDVFSKMAGCVLIVAVLLRAFSIHHAADSDRKRWSWIGIALTIASFLLPIVYLCIQKIYLPVDAANDPIAYARSMLAAPRPIAWLQDQGLIVFGAAWVLLGAAFSLSNLAIQLDQTRGIARLSLAAVGPIFILVGLLLSIGAWTVAAPLGIAVVVTFVASNAVLTGVFLRAAR